MRLEGRDIYLDTLERADCRSLWLSDEPDLDVPTDEPRPGHSAEKADAWFDEIQKLQGERHLRLGIFLRDGGVIGDVALQDIDRANRKCSLGCGIAKREHRARGYGRQASLLMLDFGFRYMGLERVSANTLDVNIGARRSLEACGFVLEGVERESVWLCGEKHDRYLYAILKREFAARKP